MTGPITDPGKLAICAAIRNAIKKRGLNRNQFGALCFPDSHGSARALATNVTHWINDRGLPGPKYHAVVQKALHLNFEAIEREGAARTGVMDILRIAHEEAPRAKKPAKIVNGQDASHFSFSVREDGAMQLHIAATVPGAIGWRFVDLMREITESGGSG